MDSHKHRFVQASVRVNLIHVKASRSFSCATIEVI